MRVFNLTDIPTKVLEQQRLVEQHIAIGRRMSIPGEYVDVEDPAGILRAKLTHLLTVGAVSIDQVPPAYAKAKQTSSGHLGSIPVRHVTINETRVAGVTTVPDVRTDVPVPVTKFDPTAAQESEVELLVESPTQQSRSSKRKQGR